jgi:4-amino-4-deoxy-L-arabinose transferase-like glycosyltransferase
VNESRQANSSNARRGNSWTREDWIVLTALLLAAGVAFSFGLKDFGILDPSDGYYAEGAREMFESGNYLTPQLNYMWFFDKPILNYWMIAASYHLFGVHEFAARVPAALCGGAVVPLMYAFAREIFSRKNALIASLVLLASPMWLVLGHMSLTDMPLACFITVALGSFFLAVETNRKNIALVGYAAIGLGLLTKGPLALFLVGLNFMVYLLLSRRFSWPAWQEALQDLQIIPGMLIVTTMSLPWYLAENAATQGTFFQEFFLNQNLNRAVGAVDHKAGLWYYIPVLIGGTFPWSILLVANWKLAARPFLNLLRRQAPTFSPLRTKATAFSATVTMTTFCFFSLLPTKLLTYILPSIPFAALLIGITFSKPWRSGLGQTRTSKIWQIAIPALIIVSVSAAAAIICAFSECLPLPALPMHQLRALNAFLSNTDTGLRQVLATALFLLSGGAIVLFSSVFVPKLKHQRELANSFVALTVAAVCGAVPAGIELGYAEKCKDLQGLLKYAKEKQIDPIMLGHRSPSAVYYLQHKVRFLADTQALLAYLAPEKSKTYQTGSDTLTRPSKPIGSASASAPETKVSLQASKYSWPLITAALPPCPTSVQFVLVPRVVIDELRRSGLSIQPAKESGEWVLAQYDKSNRAEQ